MRVDPLTIMGLALLVLINASWQVYAIRKAVHNGFQPIWLFVGIRSFNIIAVFVVALAVLLYLFGG